MPKSQQPHGVRQEEAANEIRAFVACLLRRAGLLCLLIVWPIPANGAGETSRDHGVSTGRPLQEIRRAATSGPKAADATTVTSNGQKANENGEKLGPSSKEVGHSTTHSTKKGAKEAAARRSADGKARHDASPRDGRGGHFHPNKTEDKGSDHHYYPKKRNH